MKQRKKKNGERGGIRERARQQEEQIASLITGQRIESDRARHKTCQAEREVDDMSAHQRLAAFQRKFLLSIRFSVPRRPRDI